MRQASFRASRPTPNRDPSHLERRPDDPTWTPPDSERRTAHCGSLLSDPEQSMADRPRCGRRPRTPASGPVGAALALRTTPRRRAEFAAALRTTANTSPLAVIEPRTERASSSATSARLRTHRRQTPNASPPNPEQRATDRPWRLPHPEQPPAVSPHVPPDSEHRAPNRKGVAVSPRTPDA
jgi:hypothetical protein